MLYAASVSGSIAIIEKTHRVPVERSSPSAGSGPLRDQIRHSKCAPTALFTLTLPLCSHSEVINRNQLGLAHAQLAISVQRLDGYHAQVFRRAFAKLGAQPILCKRVFEVERAPMPVG